MFRRIKNPNFDYTQNTLRYIHTKFGSKWSSSVRGEQFWKIVNDDDGDDERQVMAILLKMKRPFYSIQLKVLLDKLLYFK